MIETGDRPTSDGSPPIESVSPGEIPTYNNDDFKDLEELPPDWSEIGAGATFSQISTQNKKVNTKTCKPIGLYPVIDQGASTTSGYVDDPAKVIASDTPVVVFGDHTRVLKWVDFPFVPGADGTKVLAPSPHLHNRFFYHQFTSFKLPNKGYARHFKYLAEQSFRLPPLAEQKIIAAKLDQLLAQVDTLKTRLDTLPKILKHFRQSVLAAAVSGRLTEGWRGEGDAASSHEFYDQLVTLPLNYERVGKQAIKGTLDLGKAWLPSLPPSWCYKTVDQLYQSNHLFEYIDGNHGSLYPRKEDFGSSGVLFVTATQITDRKEIEWSDVPRLKQEIADSLTKGWSCAGDILLTHNATVGRTAIVPDSVSEQFLLGTSVTMYRTEDRYLNRLYLYYFFSSRMWQSQLEAVMEQSTRNQVSITKQALMKIALPPVSEQQEIVRRVEQLFAYADQIEQQVKNAQARVNHLTQSILAKAFRGELTAEWREQNPHLITGKSSAQALLERIKAERELGGAVKKVRKGKK